MQVQEAYDVDVPLLVLLTVVGAFLLLLLVTVLVVKSCMFGVDLMRTF